MVFLYLYSRNIRDLSQKRSRCCARM
jgi:hypothetical protein